MLNQRLSYLSHSRPEYFGGDFSRNNWLFVHHDSSQLNAIRLAAMSHLLPARELKLGPPQGLDDGILVLVVGPHAHEGLADADASHGALGLAKGAAHPGLEPISSSARQHLVDAEHMEGVDMDADVELILGRVLHHILQPKRRIGEREGENRK